jgi:filamentous hemagglutinin
VTPGDVDLIAPNGTVDAGDAGIRASGNLNIAAAQVLNADNISVSGTSAGVPASAPPAAPNVAGLSSASSSSAATSNAAQDVTRQAESQQAEAEQLPSTVTVEVLGYGGGERGREEDDREARLGSASGDVVL